MKATLVISIHRISLMKNNKLILIIGTVLLKSTSNELRGYESLRLRNRSHAMNQ